MFTVVPYDLGCRIWERTDGDEVRGTRVGSGTGGRADRDSVGRAGYGCATVTAINHTRSFVGTSGRSFQSGLTQTRFPPHFPQTIRDLNHDTSVSWA